MECDFQVGDAVVCVHDYEADHTSPFLRRWGILLPQLDEHYHIASIHVCDCGGNHITVTLKEIVQPRGFRVTFFHTSFRKLLTIDDFKSTEIDAPVDRIKEPELT